MSHPPSFVSLAIRYVIVAILTAIALGAMSWALETYTDLSPPAALGVIALFVPAMDAGMTFARKAERVPTAGEAWRISFGLYLVNLVASALAFIGLASAIDALPSWKEVTAVVDPDFLAGGLAVFILLGLIVTRLFFGIGARNHIKAMSR